MEVITTHTNSDFDSLASMLAAKKLYPDAVLVFPGSQERSLRDFFINSTFYMFHTKKIKEVNLDKVSKLILVDTRQSGRIGRFSEILDKKGLEVVIYDHHPKSKDDIKSKDIIVEEVGSTTTILTDILKKKRVHISAEEATIMMLGIYEDTGSLTFSTTTEKDYKAAAYLLKKGANLNVVSDLMTKELTTTQVQMLNELLNNMKVHNIHGIDVVISTASSKEYVGDLAILVHKLKDLENLDAVIVLVRMEDRIYLIARSRIEEVNVGNIAVEFGGGGHSVAASATIRDLTLIQANDKVLKILHEKVAPKKIAVDVMVYPVRILDSEESFKKAQSIMYRYRLNSMPVVSKKKVVGLITRNIVEKTLFHKLGDHKIKEYMIKDFSVVNTDATLSAVQELIIDNNQKIVPVIKDNEIAGVITRTDLLRIFSNQRIDESIKKDRSDISGVLRKKTVVKIMEDILQKNVQGILKEVGNVGDLLGYNVYAVGGFVRDLILRRENFDIDIVVEGDGIHFADEFAKLNDCHINCHKKFRTAVIIFPNGFKVDIASSRVEYYKHPAALPEIEISSIKLDLYRRDFTINTLALKLNHSDYGGLIDYFGAYKDIKAKMIRVLHNLSFVEDPTRIFRAVRFEQRFKFNIDKHTLNLIKNAEKISLFDKLSGKRLLTELKFMFDEDEPINSLNRLDELNLFKFIHKKINFSKSKAIILRLKEVLSWFDLMFLDEKYERWLVYFIALTDTLTINEHEQIKKRLSIIDNHSIKVINDSNDVSNILNSFQRIISRRNGKINSEVYHLLKGISTEVILYMMAKTVNKQVKKLISRYFTHLKQTKIVTTGKDLLKLGFKEGKDFKNIFLRLLNERLNGNIKTKDNEMAFINSLKIKKN
jgi:tRNA nucleotidyltransferase (CCA-adding enzyme)